MAHPLISVICQEWLEGWFKKTPISKIKRGNIQEPLFVEIVFVSFVAFVCFKNQQAGTNTGIIKLPKLEGIKQ